MTCPSHTTGSEAAAVCIHVNDKARRVAPPQNHGNFIGFSARFSCSLIKLTSRLTGETETLLILLQYLCVFITAAPITKPPRQYAYLLALVNTRAYMPPTAQWHDLQSRSVVGFRDFPIRKISTGHGQGVSRYVWRDSLLSDSPLIPLIWST